MTKPFVSELLSVHHCCLRMFQLMLLFLTLSGLQAVPLAVPRRLQRTSSTQWLPEGFQQGTEHFDIREPVPDGFRQGTEPFRRFLVDLNTGLVQEHISELDRRVAFIRHSLGNGFGEMERRHWLTDEVPVDVPAQQNGGGWARVEEHSAPHIPDGYRQGTEPMMSIPDGFRQGTEPMMSIPDGFRQGTEPMMSIPDGFRQGTEPMMSIPDGFRQGTEPILTIPEGFRQGTEPILTIPEGFRQGTEPILTILEGFRQGTESLTSRLQTQTQTVACKGEVINENCYEFNSTPLAFQDAQVLCRALAPNAELASVTSGDLHSRLVSLVTKDGESNPVLTWLGGMVKNQQALWVDGSEWSYSDWMPGHPNIHTDKPVCVEMFKIDESWWTAADCELKRASICSYPITA
ncbi:uncharacterized protein LOC122872238 isoform X2 [Siniperca chuatsi]|uniref:uncharacterized protein LOC122872238 isoform X2 n=1 Tax=Siniperca chuatsi TaxID=119488 RepID=UPI001CE20C70|nr:uncharacterized protein LOC122872238 isoform X2 [Siniperca chuatsi]